LGKLYIFDFTADRQLALLSSIYEEATWIDHHVWEHFEVPSNVKLVVDSKSPSTAQLVSEHFKVYSKLVEWANEIDSNSVQSEEAMYLRNLIGAIKRSFTDVRTVNKELRRAASELAFSSLREIKEKEENKKLIEGYLKWVAKASLDVAKGLKVLKLGKYRVAIYETQTFVPAYVVCDVLRKRFRLPFDVVAVLVHHPTMTYVDLRSFTDTSVLKIAKYLGGGGHEEACSARTKPMKGEDFIQILKQVYGIKD
jgi:oligoribonuclease NrnB/cAMP/cGMP phosphodiesterase (DHH superfamily)